MQKIAAALVATLALTGCANRTDAGDNAASDSSTRAERRKEPRPEKSTMPPQKMPTVTTKSSPKPKPKPKPPEAALSSDLISAVGAMGLRYGYLYRENFGDYRFFAQVVKGDCQEVARGETSWNQLISEAITDGAPPSAANGMNSYLRDVFCPALGL